MLQKTHTFRRTLHHPSVLRSHIPQRGDLRREREQARERDDRVMDDRDRERVGGVEEGSVGDVLVKINIS